MRKITVHDKESVADGLNRLIHEAYAMTVKEIQRHELEAYITSDGLPDIDKMDNDDNITVAHVLAIGMYLSTNALHDGAHNTMDEASTAEKVKVLGLNNLPPDVREAIKKALKGDN